MNIKNKGVLAIAVAMVLGSASAPVFAVADQATGPQSHKEGRMPPRPHHDQWNPNPWRVFEGLNLTEEQKDKIQDLIKDGSEDQKDAFKDGMKYNQKLRELSASDDYSKDKAEDIAKDGAKVLTKAAVDRAEVDNKIFNVLTPEQKTKYKENLKQRDDAFKERLDRVKDAQGDVPPPPPAPPGDRDAPPAPQPK